MNWQSNWNSWADFVNMGGYGLYVWSSFGMAALVVLIEVLWLRAGGRRLRRSGTNWTDVAPAAVPARRGV